MSKKTKTSPTMRLMMVGGVLVILVAVGGFVAKSMGWLGGEGEGKTVETAKAKLKTITQMVSASGKIQPEVEVILRPEVSGEIIELPVKEGDYVAKDDLLLRIKPDIYEARIEETNATLLTQKARLEQAKANLLEAESTYNQQQQLFEKEAISRAQYIQAKTAYEAQKANYKAAEYQVQSIEAQLDQAKEELAKTTIRSPRDGTISALAVEEGERVLGQTQMTGTELMRISKMDQMEVVVQVNENDIVNVAPGDTTNIEVDAYPERIFNGIVTEIANSAEITGSGTNEQVTNYEVKIRITTPHNLDMAGSQDLVQQAAQELPGSEFVPSFKPGMSATVDIETETVFNVVSLPIQAVTVRDFAEDSTGVKSDSTNVTESDTSDTDGGMVIPEEDLRKVVFKVEDGIAKRQQVETGISDNSHIQILSGISAGDEIVIGSYRTLSRDLKDGDKVKVDNNQFQRFAQN
ncbi:efflux RND transporter periplasmic adaptor subunit [Aliifodinibius sp. S!AR15-10]|uniref:efflux RND transporter periplasmic adaptor subunit n=1 Tax=Aliifodinibius sp. S!AR15-10 TaxID=2950437 RepID=UPI002856952B|nr:efflux RND transporter periplasmic adaptor subunit [Aliifodinibius sp. S!AR15-10]MDR8390131.1 efflux RND transporter periplasmic adaptor subunit [Aliifodinibius sp. S!AR15-10]